MHELKLVCLVKRCSEGQAADPATAIDGNLYGCHYSSAGVLLPLLLLLLLRFLLIPSSRTRVL
jgi:hypothetical protein